jgi:protein-disulfide isomerase
MGCVSPSLEAKLGALEAKQDSLLHLVSSMQEKHEFMAMRMGWRPPPDTNPKAIPLGKSYRVGPENAKLKLVEFSDLECPYCAQLAPILDSLHRTYPNQVSVVYKHFPLSFHKQARAAAAAAEAAGKQGKFFEFRYAVAPHFREFSDSLYLSVAGGLGLDLEAFKRDMDLTPEIEKLLDDDMALGRQIGVEGTPTLFINGRLAQNRSFEYLASLLK